MSIKQRGIGERLRACMSRGKLSISDLALWMGRSRPTIQNWARFDVEPSEVYREEALRRLKILETIVYKAKGPLIPYSVGSFQRPGYLRELYNANNDSRLSTRRAAK